MIYKYLKKCFWLLLGGLLLSFYPSQQASATHYMASDLIYECIDSCRFEVTSKVYRDCEGSSFVDGDVTISSASCGESISVDMSVVDTLDGVDVSQVCDPSLDECNGGTFPGTEIYVFRDTVNVCAQSSGSGFCDDWVITWEDCCRNYDIDNITNAFLYYC